MLSVNLLPQEEKRIVYLIEARRAVALYAACFLLAVATGTALLLPSYFSSYFFRRELERSLAIAQQGASDRGTARDILVEAKKIRDAVNEARLSLGSPMAGADIMEKFSAPGQGIGITSFLIRSSGDVAIEGRAETRDRLLAFEEYLRSSGMFLEVSFPLGDLVRERDIRFSARAKLKFPFSL